MNSSIQPTILFFDSGVGGFSVYKETKQLLPDCHYLYCFDNAFFPYSEKEEQDIIDRTLKICQQINQDYPLDLIVIACNTASTVVLPSLRQHFSIPVVGTVPAIKPAAERSETKHIGLLATKGTVKRAYVNNLIETYAHHCNVEKIGSTKLVEIAEQKLRGGAVDLNALKQELNPWQEMKSLDSVVLGCTHFPLIKEEIEWCLPQVKFFVDSGKAIAKRVQSLLANVEVRSKIQKKNLIFCTQPFEHVQSFQQVLDFWGFERLLILAEA
ncbi:glutamate racemase [Canicola haemoglobinophilus]|uniref:Glutamate racemase n=1 Tax=Canicola haemoglobinophilus TaxID=733 RepID=A0A1V4B1G2_9PAST|nr:glutamate racemase [Canicola haemoglobinophilus]OOS00953.1 glutamate racemase [Canicola haemoglobinophilus]STO54854.1 glutamate racemase [Canicola haemoglobinophilus]STO59124.1 glutamate racemase [Canicola haemoglobinophilus]STO69575.1 glutamate racemase [Canicola haemoglobinophilus]